MFKTKYIIIIGIIICILLIYYFYGEISTIKKSLVPTYQKTMALEAKILELEQVKKSLQSNKKNVGKKIESPVYSISYQSDIVKTGISSMKYADISESEAKKLVQNIKYHGTKKNTKSDRSETINVKSPKRGKVPLGELSEFDDNTQLFIAESSAQSNRLDQFNLSDRSDTINLKFSEILKRRKNDAEYSVQMGLDNIEYDKILLGLSTNLTQNYLTDNLDQDAIRNISESIKHTTGSDENILIKTKKIPKHTI